MYDIAIIGAGPAGLSAAITARARNKKVLIISNHPDESYLARASLVDNYPAVASISGKDLLRHMVDHACDLGVDFEFQRVISILPFGEHFMVNTSGEPFEARSVILAVGVSMGKQYPGEAEYLGRGVSYCATCDGMLYRNRTVSVIGMMPEAVVEADFLASIGCTVHFIAKKTPDDLSDKVIMHRGTVAEIVGDELGVTGVRLTQKTAQKSSEQEETYIPSDGVFILRPSIAPDALLSGLELDGGHIVTDKAMRTNIPGVFAAGDCLGEPLQISKAAGEGQTALFSAVEYLEGRAQNTST